MSIETAALDVVIFVKTHEYPAPMSDDFNVLTDKLDRLETELRRAGLLRGNVKPLEVRLP